MSTTPTPSTVPAPTAAPTARAARITREAIEILGQYFTSAQWPLKVKVVSLSLETGEGEGVELVRRHDTVVGRVLQLLTGEGEGHHIVGL